MKISRSLIWMTAAGLVWSTAAATVAHAGDFYVAGGFGFARDKGEADGSFDVPGLLTDLGGEDTDQSPVYQVALGFETNLYDVFRIPEFPRWKMRFEYEFQGGRDFELKTDGPATVPGVDFRSDGESWNFLHSIWFHAPVHTPFSALFGRLPILEPLSVYTGGGVGVAGIEIDTESFLVEGDVEEKLFAWQVGTGLHYELTDHVAFTVGYRYLNLGKVEADLDGTAGEDRGEYSLDLSSHEIRTMLQVNFFSVPFPPR
ncbi:MAG: outer membrane beta-barrel protein [Proteobacteria bacterium]|nr:outer membrane beta-barrel protein [Pseudomonadota bacterium]